MSCIDIKLKGIHKVVLYFDSKQPCFQEHIFEHFNGDGHSGFLENVGNGG